MANSLGTRRDAPITIDERERKKKKMYNNNSNNNVI